MRNPVIRSELKKFGLIELVFLGITLTVLQVKHLTDDEIKFIHEFLRQCIEINHLEPYLRQERFVTAIRNAHVIDLVEQDFSDFQKFKKDIEARSNELASKKRNRVSDNDPAGESLRASSVSADVADDDNTCCFHHFLASLGSAEDEETSSSSHLPQVQEHVQQPASDESHIEEGMSEEDSHPTTDLGRKRENSGNQASEGDIYATAQPLQKRAKTVSEVRAELPTAANTGGCLQEHQTPNVGPLTASPSVTQDRVLRTVFSGTFRLVVTKTYFGTDLQSWQKMSRKIAPSVFQETHQSITSSVTKVYLMWARNCVQSKTEQH
ncbi:hypothetical protein FOXYS1_401 [Fusarium oxysporum]|uniref:Uncharacterized protein n=1 Tax=Fusarium oxysporum TaxID=5507 RepID=A0A8H5EPM3_FUSOX|nr:hypothetical protein FOXYS1_401 [Fusarium oxysporum]